MRGFLCAVGATVCPSFNNNALNEMAHIHYVCMFLKNSNIRKMKDLEEV